MKNLVKQIDKFLKDTDKERDSGFVKALKNKKKVLLNEKPVQKDGNN